jgi:hypothetical protein
MLRRCAGLRCSCDLGPLSRTCACTATPHQNAWHTTVQRDADAQAGTEARACLKARSTVLRLAPDAVPIAVEVVRIGVGHVPADAEVAVGNVPTVQVRRGRRDADGRIRRGALPARRWRRRLSRGPLPTIPSPRARNCRIGSVRVRSPTARGQAQAKVVAAPVAPVCRRTTGARSPRRSRSVRTRRRSRVPSRPRRTDRQPRALQAAPAGYQP